MAGKVKAAPKPKVERGGVADDGKAKAIELRRSGWTVAKIARELGTTTARVRRWTGRR